MGSRALDQAAGRPATGSIPGGALSSPALDVRARLAALLREAADLVEAWPALHQERTVLDDRALRIREACERMGWSYSWARRRWARLGGFLDEDGKLKIAASKLGAG